MFTQEMVLSQSLLYRVNGSKGQFTRCNNVSFFLTPTVGSMATNGSVYMDTTVSDF